jgi:hypothetical protein
LTETERLSKSMDAVNVVSKVDIISTNS